jgi:hypothetical protein
MPWSPSSRFGRLAIALAVVLATAGGARLARAAADIDLLFSSLPSAQGWTYTSAGVVAPETPTWSLSGGVLGFDTMPYLTNTSGTGTSSFYFQLGVVTNFEPIVIEVRARVLQFESDGSSSQAGCFAFGFTQGATQWFMGINTTQIRNIAGTILSSAYDNTQFHDYRLEWSPPSTVAYYVDNTLISTNSAGLAQALSRIFFGDGTGAANARVEMTHYRFRQGPAVTAATSTSWGRIKSLYR